MYGKKGDWGHLLSFGRSNEVAWESLILDGRAMKIGWRLYWYGLACLAFGWRRGPAKRLMVDVGPFTFEARS